MAQPREGNDDLLALVFQLLVALTDRADVDHVAGILEVRVCAVRASATIVTSPRRPSGSPTVDTPGVTASGRGGGNGRWPFSIL
jgi:hypothetical protein